TSGRRRRPGAAARAEAPGRPGAPGDLKERTTAEHGPDVGSCVPLPGPEPCSAVATGILGVHAGGSGAFVYRNAPPPQDRCPDRATLFALPQSDPVTDPNTSSAAAAN